MRNVVIHKDIFLNRAIVEHNNSDMFRNYVALPDKTVYSIFQISYKFKLDTAGSDCHDMRLPILCFDIGC